MIQKLRIVVIGGDSVGKSSLISKLAECCSIDQLYNKSSYAKVKQELNESLTSIDNSISSSSKGDIDSYSNIADNQDIRSLRNRTSEVSIIENYIHKGKQYRVTLIDTQSQTSQTTLDNKYYNDINGYILMFSHSNQASFELIEELNKKLINKVGLKYIPRILIGNKNDLKSDIEKEKIKKLKHRILTPYISCSVLNNTNVSSILPKLINEIRKEANEEHPYDIKNLGKELTYIGRHAKFFRFLIIYMLNVILIISLILFIFDLLEFIESLDVMAVTLPSMVCSVYTIVVALLSFKYAKIKDSEKMLRLAKWFFLSILSILVILSLLIYDSAGSDLDYLTFGLYLTVLIMEINTYIISKAVFPLYLSN